MRLRHSRRRRRGVGIYFIRLSRNNNIILSSYYYIIIHYYLYGSTFIIIIIIPRRAGFSLRSSSASRNSDRPDVRPIGTPLQLLHMYLPI